MPRHACRILTGCLPAPVPSVGGESNAAGAALLYRNPSLWKSFNDWNSMTDGFC